jgi:putative aldouronate transport system substrate-binding protein
VTVNTAFNDGLREILLGRKPLSDYDGLVRDWASAAGDQIRQEYTEAMAATS